MPYITSIEQMGIEQGEDRATQKIALKMLGKNIPLETGDRISPRFGKAEATPTNHPKATIAFEH
jgi:hypothetical protein